jgi:hypothetical protein
VLQQNSKPLRYAADLRIREPFFASLGRPSGRLCLSLCVLALAAGSLCRSLLMTDFLLGMAFLLLASGKPSFHWIVSKFDKFL